VIEVRSKWLVAALLVAACLPAAGCGGNTAGDGEATIKSMKLPGYGPVLATADDKPLYLLTSDPKGGTNCTGECTQEWKPLTTGGDKPTVGKGLSGDLVGTFDRDDGDGQVLYNGHALFTYTRSDPGIGVGAGAKWRDGTWYLVSPEGEAIKATATGGY
jgi:predicted lipoprotein with Yx(FWY)xxD motif